MKLSLAFSLTSLLAACGGPADHPVTPSVRSAACTVMVSSDRNGDTSRISVGGVDLAIDLTTTRSSRVMATTWPLGASSVLLGWSANSPTDIRFGSSDLYEVDCAAPAHPKVFARLAGASFGHAAMTADGKTLYFTGADGARALDLATRRIRVVTVSPRLVDCADDRNTRDYVTAVNDADDILVLSRGSSCNVMGEFRATTWFVDHPADHPEAVKQARAARPVTAVAIDAGGAWWAGADDTLWSSTDHGTHWTRSALHDQGAPELLAIDPTKPGQLVVRTVERLAMGAPFLDGLILVTHNGGKSWVELPLPAELGQGNPHDRLDLDVAVNADVDHLTLWANTDQNGEGNPDKMWTTSDAGATWQPAAPTARPGPSRSAKAGTIELRASPDGLLVVEPGSARPRRIYVQ